MNRMGSLGPATARVPIRLARGLQGEPSGTCAATPHGYIDAKTGHIPSPIYDLPKLPVQNACGNSPTKSP